MVGSALPSDVRKKRLEQPCIISDWIRKNIPPDKVRRARTELEHYEKDFFSSDENGILIEHVYRGVKDSIKVQWCYGDALHYCDVLTYLLLPDKKELGQKSEIIERDMIQCFGDRSFLFTFHEQLKNTVKKDIKKKKIPIGYYYYHDKVTLKLIGGEVLFYYCLTSVLSVIERALNDKKYKIPWVLDWQEAIARYVLFENKEIRKKQRSEEKELPKSHRKTLEMLAKE